MKTRIDNLLEIADKQINENAGSLESKEALYRLEELCKDLAALILDESERTRLLSGFAQIKHKALMTQWDERFLRVISGEEKKHAYDDLVYKSTIGRTASTSQALHMPYIAGGSGSGPGLTTVAAESYAEYMKYISQDKN